MIMKAGLKTMMSMILEILMVSSIIKSLRDQLTQKEKVLNNNLFTEYLKYQDPDSMLKDLNSTRNTERTDIQVALITSALTDFGNKINSVSENGIRFE